MHLVLADDHKLVLEALQNYLKKLSPEIQVTEANDFGQALERVSKAQSVDLVILDLNMPGMGGLRGLSIMRERFPRIPVVLLSGETDSAMIRQAINEGAAGFIPKHLSGKAMLKALELVLSGEIYVPSMALSPEGADGDGKALAAEGDFGPDSPLSMLTPREFEVLSLLIKGHSNKQIARELGLKDITIAFHLKGVFRKLHVSSRTEAIIAAVKLGWKI